MIIKDKARYALFCQEYKNLPVYFNNWYLDYACGENNWEVLICIENEQLYGVLPFYKSTIPLLGKKIGMPRITPFMGVYLVIPEGLKKVSRGSLEKKVVGELVDALPKFCYFNVRFHRSFGNWLPFFWKGYLQQTMYTYVIPDISNTEEVFANFKSSVRNKIRKAEHLVTVELSQDIETFYLLNKMSFERQNKKIGYDLANLKRMDEVFARNNARRIFLAKGNDGRVHSALYLTFDRVTAYVHLIGEDPALRNSGAGALLVWEAIKYAHRDLGLTEFDFEGSVIENIEENRRAYGADQVPYHRIRKVNSFMLRLAFSVIKW